MKKLFFLLPAMLTIVFVLSAIHADEDANDQPEPKTTEKPDIPEETPKVDPNKKYEIKFDFKKGMSFERTETSSSQTTKTLFNSDLTVKRTIKTHMLKSNEQRYYKIIDVKDGKITKFRLEFPEYAVRLGRNPMGESTFTKSATVYANQWVEVNSSNADWYKIEKHSPELASLTEDEEKLYKGMLSLESKRSGSPRQLGFDPIENMISLHFKPNIQFLDKFIDKLLVPDYSPEKPVSVGDTWKIKSAEFNPTSSGSADFINRKLIGFVSEYWSPVEIEFKLDSVKVENNTTYAVLTFDYKYSGPSQSPFSKASKTSYVGRIVHDLTKNRIVNFTVESKHETIWQQSEFGKYVSQSTNAKTFEYKYSD